MPDTSGLLSRNKERWQVARLLPNRKPMFANVARRLAAAKARYQAIEAATKVPWWVIAVIHEREASQSWSKSIAQGDPWNRKSTHVPKGRGPFASFEEAAIDALMNCAPYAGRWKDWTPGGAMTLLEQYNGLGYFRKGKPSPYVWSGTDQYARGKYVADGVYDQNVIDAQLGCAGLVLAMAEIDSDIAAALGGKAPPPTMQPTNKPASNPTPPATGKPSAFSWLRDIFKRG